MAGLVITSAPAVEPVSLAELKQHLRITGDDNDSMLTIYGKAARIAAERHQNRQLITATLKYTLESFPWGEFVLPRPPLIAITSIQYVDTAGDTQTWASSKYQVDTNTLLGRVKPVSTESYPSIQGGTYNAVTVTYTAGYGAAGSDVPDITRNGILLFAAQLYEFREPIVSGTIVAQLPDHLKIVFDAEKAPFVAS